MYYSSAEDEMQEAFLGMYSNNVMRDSVVTGLPRYKPVDQLDLERRWYKNFQVHMPPALLRNRHHGLREVLQQLAKTGVVSPMGYAKVSRCCESRIIYVNWKHLD